MPTKITADSLIDVIQRSGLISEADLGPTLEQLDDKGVDIGDPQAIAESLISAGKLTRWQSDHLLAGKHRGFFIGPYRFLKMLGKGGMGAVYLAEHQMMRRRCAIKILPSQRAKQHGSMLERFYLEAQAVAALDDPNIVRAYDVNKDVQGNSEIHYLVMEYVEGQDLQNKVIASGSGLEYVEAADYTRQAAKGLAHAHQNGLIHRDIKPANLLVDTKGVVKILDLGLARFFNDKDEASLTKEHNESTLGTADYLSPEQALSSHDVDTRTDIYSLGCTLYFFLTARPPFPEGSVAQRLLAHQVKAPAPISKFRRDVPDDLVAIVDQMIAKKAQDRFQTADQVAEVLAAWLVKHANDTWKQAHPEVARAGAEAAATARREPTRGIAGSFEDTEMELGFADLDEDQPEPVQETSVPAAAAPAAPAPQPVTETPRTAAAEFVEALPPLEKAGTSDPLADIDLGVLEAISSDSDVLSPATSGIGSPSASASSGSFRFSQSAVGQMSSGIYQQVPGGANPSAANTASSDSSKLIMIGSLVALGLIVPVVVVILIVMSWSSPNKTIPPTTVATAPASPDANATQPAPTPAPSNTTAVKPPTPPPTTPTKTDGGKPTSTNVKPPDKEPKTTGTNTGGANNPAGGTSTTPPVVAPTPKENNPPKTGPDQATTVPPVEPKTTPPVEPTTAPPDKTNDEKAAAERAKRLLAGIKEVSFKLESIDGNPRSTLNLAIGRMASEALIAAGLTPGPGSDAPALLHVKLAAENRQGVMVLWLGGELTVKDGSDTVTVWGHQEEIGNTSPQILQRGIPSALLQQYRSNVDGFYRRLTRDYEAARRK